MQTHFSNRGMFFSNYEQASLPLTPVCFCQGMKQNIRSTNRETSKISTFKQVCKGLRQHTPFRAPHPGQKSNRMATLRLTCTAIMPIKNKDQEESKERGPNSRTGDWLGNNVFKEEIPVPPALPPLQWLAVSSKMVAAAPARPWLCLRQMLLFTLGERPRTVSIRKFSPKNAHWKGNEAEQFTVTEGGKNWRDWSQGWENMTWEEKSHI